MRYRICTPKCGTRPVGGPQKQKDELASSGYWASLQRAIKQGSFFERLKFFFEIGHKLTCKGVPTFRRKRTVISLKGLRELYPKSLGKATLPLITPRQPLSCSDILWDCLLHIKLKFKKKKMQRYPCFFGSSFQEALVSCKTYTKDWVGFCCCFFPPSWSVSPYRDLIHEPRWGNMVVSPSTSAYVSEHHWPANTSENISSIIIFGLWNLYKSQGVQLHQASLAFCLDEGKMKEGSPSQCLDLLPALFGALSLEALW